MARSFDVMGNFAYFCKFDRDTRKIGAETLVTSAHPPLEIYRDAGSGLNSLLGEIAQRTGRAADHVPIFFTFDYVRSIYPDLDVKTSAWPQIAAIVPTEVRQGKFIRNGTTNGYLNNNSGQAAINLKISESIERIRAGELLQVVLSSRINLDHYDFGLALRAFMEVDRSLYVFLYRFGRFTIVGSSPENLITIEGKRLCIYPIAGSRPRGKNVEEDMILADELRNDSKELLEHRMLVDLARNDLGKVSVPGSVEVTRNMEIQKFSTVQHLVSCVESTLEEGITMDEVMKSVFPAGTVSGAPKKKAIELIGRYEENPRGPYSGAIGMACHDGIDAALLIRSVFSDGEETYAQAGAGIVKDSNPAAEQREICAKLSTVMVVAQ